MNKKYAGILIVLAIIGIIVFNILFEQGGINCTLQNVEQNLKFYHLEANMEMINGDDTRNFLVKVTYLDKEDKDYYRVSLLDKSVNQEQLIIRNQDGVYVLTPALNQIYKFKGDWPNNSPKPYLYQSILGSLKTQNDVKGMDDGYLVTSRPSYQNATSWVKHEVKLSKNLVPLWAHIFDKDDYLRVKVTFTKFEFNPNVELDVFKVEPNMQIARKNGSEVTSTIEDLPLFPVGVDMSATLKDKTTVTINGAVVHILSYDGEKPFTVVLKLLEDQDEAVLTDVEGEMCDLTNGVGFYHQKTLTYVYNGVEYKILSDVLSVSELIDVANGMEIVTGEG